MKRFIIWIGSSTRVIEADCMAVHNGYLHFYYTRERQMEDVAIFSTGQWDCVIEEGRELKPEEGGSLQ